MPPSFPGTPATTKYPIFYPWILSWDLALNKSLLPANLTGAVVVSVLFGITYLIAAFFFLRQLRGIDDLEALLITGFCPLHPLILFFGARVLSDMPIGV